MISNIYRSDASGVKDVAADSGRAPEGMAGLAKGLSILEAFGPGRESLTISEAADAAQITRAAARRCLLQLTELGYLSQTEKQFRPTPRVMRLGQAYLAAAPLPQIAGPFLAEARAALGESISLTVLDGDMVGFIARAEAARVVSTGFRVGVRVPAWSTAAGRVLLAGLSDDELDRMLVDSRPTARTERTVTDPVALHRLIVEARHTGYAMTDEELEIGMRSIAVPVRDARGTVIAAVSTSSFTGRATVEEMLASFLPALRTAAAAIEKRL